MTSAQLPRDLKNQLSHRGQALALLVEKLAVQELAVKKLNTSSTNTLDK